MKNEYHQYYSLCTNILQCKMCNTLSRGQIKDFRIGRYMLYLKAGYLDLCIKAIKEVQGTSYIVDSLVYPFFLTDLDPLVLPIHNLLAMSVIPKLNGAQQLSAQREMESCRFNDLICQKLVASYYPLFLSLVWLVGIWYTNHHLLLLKYVVDLSLYYVYVPIYIQYICPKSLIYLLISLKEKVGA